MFDLALCKAEYCLNTTLGSMITADGILNLMANQHFLTDIDEEKGGHGTTGPGPASVGYVQESQSLCSEYGIKQGAPMTIEHILSIICYTDFDTLSYNFSTTFRKLNKTETNKEMKQRNSEYWHWSKRLRECVECYGTTVHHDTINIYYHGVSYMVLIHLYRILHHHINYRMHRSGSNICKREWYNFRINRLFLRFFDCSWCVMPQRMRDCLLEVLLH